MVLLHRTNGVPPSVEARRRRGAIDSSGMCQRDDTLESEKHLGIRSGIPRKLIDRFENEKAPCDEGVIRSGSKKNGSYMEPLNTQSFTDFDWFAVLDTTAYNGWGHF